MLLKKIALYHLAPLAVAIGLVALFIQITSPGADQAYTVKSKTISGEQMRQSGILMNYADGEQSEIDLIASLKNKNQLTLFGSSEFTNTPYGSYNFLPDSLGIQTLGVGHAHHQELSILCELLAAKKYLKGSKICVFLSPGWFTNDTPELDGGTNIEAFLEFVPPHFLSNIAYDKSIAQKYRSHIGEFINRNYNKINSPSKSMKLLKEEYLKPSNSALRNMQISMENKIYGTKNPLAAIYTYNVSMNPGKLTAHWNKNWDDALERTQNEFKKKSVNNDLHVSDEYYQKFLLQKNGKVIFPAIEPLDLKNCREFKDFKLLLELLKENEVECSFVIQPLNPYYYRNIENYNELWTSVEALLNANKVPYLNLFADNREEYDSGTLQDVMHLGDYGWMKVNRFLYATYYE